MALHLWLKYDRPVAAALGVGDAAAKVFGGFTFVLGFLVVFRSQQGYARWWEGGTLMQQLRGEWFNAFSCLLAFCNAAEDKRLEVRCFQHQLVRLFSLLYGCALTQVSTLEKKQFELIALDGLSIDSIEFLQSCPDRCEIVLQWIQRLIVESEQSAVLKIAPPILSRVYNELGNGIVNLNNARKIKEFPIPFPLAQMIMVMLIFHTVVTPFICAATVQTTSWAAMITFVVIFSYWSILYIALELEMPFGDDLNDLPLVDMALDMNKSLARMLASSAQRVPSFDFVPAVHESLLFTIVDFDGDLIDYAEQGTFKSRNHVDCHSIAVKTERPPDEELHDKINGGPALNGSVGIGGPAMHGSVGLGGPALNGSDGIVLAVTTVPVCEQLLPLMNSPALTSSFRASQPRPSRQTDGSPDCDCTFESPRSSPTALYGAHAARTDRRPESEALTQGHSSSSCGMGLHERAGIEERHSSGSPGLAPYERAGMEELSKSTAKLLICSPQSI